MLKTFLRTLSEGISKDDISQENQSLLNSLLLSKAVKQKDDFYKLDTKYRFGTIDISRTGTGYLSVLSSTKSKDLIVEGDDLNGASKGDIVLAKRLFSKGNRPKAKVIEILKKEFDVIVGYTKLQDNKIVVLNIKNDLPITVAASQKALKDLPLGTVMKIDNYTSIISEILGVLEDPKVDEKISLALYNKTEIFPNECEIEAKSYGNSVDKSMYPKREDLTHLPFCTIDPPDAKDFDDAIYFDLKQSALYVAIADVSEYVSAFGALDMEAKNRGFTIYFPHKSIPMLPRSLSENICSLKPNVDRLAFIYKITIDPVTLQSVKEELIEGIIHSKRRYTYDKIDLFLEGDFSQKDEVDDVILDYLLPLQKLLGKIRSKRLENGCEFRNDEIRMTLDEEQNLIGVKVEKETPSHALIEDAMLLANKAAAKALKKGIYRTHESPSEAKIDELLDDLAIIGVYGEDTDNIYELIRSLQRSADAKDVRQDVDKLIIRAQQKAVYNHENKGHFGLGFEHYTHFTSPIRRYSDLIVHRLLKAIKHKDKKLEEFILQDIDIVAMRVSELEREAAQVAWDFMDRKYARYALAHIGESYKARIVDTDRTPIANFEEGLLVGARVFLLDYDVELFEEVKVELVDSFITSAKIIGSIKEWLIKEDV